MEWTDASAIFNPATLVFVRISTRAGGTTTSHAEAAVNVVSATSIVSITLLLLAQPGYRANCKEDEVEGNSLEQF